MRPRMIIKMMTMKLRKFHPLRRKLRRFVTKIPNLRKKIELVHQLRFLLTLNGIRESGINMAPLKGILKKLGVEEYKDILSSQGIASIGQGLMNKFLAGAFD